MHRRGRQGRGRNVTKVHAKVFAGTKSGTPEAGGKNFIEAQNPTGLKLMTAYVAALTGRCKA